MDFVTFIAKSWKELVASLITIRDVTPILFSLKAKHSLFAYVSSNRRYKQIQLLLSDRHQELKFVAPRLKLQPQCSRQSLELFSDSAFNMQHIASKRCSDVRSQGPNQMDGDYTGRLSPRSPGPRLKKTLTPEGQC